MSLTKHSKQFFIDGAWVDPVAPATLPVINPADETAFADLSMGSSADVDKAITAAKAAFESFSLTTKAERIALMERILERYKARFEDIAQAVCLEMGAPIGFAREWQTGIGQWHIEATLQALRDMEFEEMRGTTAVLREPVGVCALITPWNWPLNQITCKVAPAIAAGCTMVLKPSEIAPVSGLIFAEVMEEAGVPAGVFNLVNGDGPSVGQVMAEHPDVDMVSFTGSTRAGVLVAKAAADTVKRVAQELGGKSPNIVLPDADFAKAVSEGAASCFGNTGQSCNAPTRMLVPAGRMEEAMEIAATVAAGVTVGDPQDPATLMGPLVSQVQYDKVQALIEKGIAEGATLACGGPGRPEGVNRGYFVRPTVFGNVDNDMTIAREEIFGPVLSILPYEDEEDAIRIANDTVYGLAAYVQGSPEAARRVARRLRAGTVHLNGPAWDRFAPFGGYKQSGNGREYADWGLHDFLEIKGVVGWG